jgi:hypothetical protein
MTRSLMRASAIFLGSLGLPATFAPDSLLRWLGAPLAPALLLLVQVLGALYVGFAVLNWMARENLIGGIYSRPLATANLTHFLIAGLAMLRLLTRAPELHWLWPLALLYAAFAAAFGLVLFRHPVRAAAPMSQPVAGA